MRQKRHADFTTLGKAADEFVGRSYGVILAWWIAATLFFAIVYFLLSYSPGNGPIALEENPATLLRFFDAIYYSVITGTSTGYGDIVPRGLSKAFAALQSMSSIALIALFVAKFSSRRQEVALAHIHEMTFDSAFHSIREGLFIARKDLDLIMKKVASKEPMGRKDWRDLRIAFRQIEIFVRKIADFYATEDQLYVVDADRERLLLDAVERTMQRVGDSLDLFDKMDVSYSHQEGCIRELKNLAYVMSRVFGSEREKMIHPESKEAFEDVLKRVEEVLRHVEKFAEKPV